MAYGDPYFEFVQSGSTTASANTQHSLFGAYGGLSDLNDDDVVHIILDCDNSMRVGSSPSNDRGTLIQGGSGIFDYPPTRAGTASQLIFANNDLGSDATANWSIYRKIP